MPVNILVCFNDKAEEKIVINIQKYYVSERVLKIKRLISFVWLLKGYSPIGEKVIRVFYELPALRNSVQ